MTRLFTIVFLLFSTVAQAQTLTSTEENSSVSGVNVDFGDRISNGTDSTVRTHPDVNVPASIPSQSTCRYGVGIGAGSLLLGGLGISTGELDEGCEARLDSSHFMKLASSVEKLRPGTSLTDKLLKTSIMRMFQTREDFVETWEEPWRM